MEDRRGLAIVSDPLVGVTRCHIEDRRTLQPLPALVKQHLRSTVHVAGAMGSSCLAGGTKFPYPVVVWLEAEMSCRGPSSLPRDSCRRAYQARIRPSRDVRDTLAQRSICSKQWPSQ